MNDSSLRDKAKPITVLVYESVTGGGLAGQELPKSWASEGSAMRRAIAKDFASVPGVRVIMPLDSRFPVEEIPRVEVRLVADPGRASLLEIVSEADYTALIAPETDGILYGLTDCLETAGATSLGTVRRALWVSDKGRLAHHFLGQEIPSPRTKILGRSDSQLPDWPGPIVVKPRRGAGSVDTVIVRDGVCPDWARKTGVAIAQPYLPGRPMSASFLVDCAGKITLLGFGRQRIDFDPDGRISYRGGTILSGVPEAQELLERAISSVNQYVGRPGGLRGFVGIDYLDDQKSGVTVLEINPRPTTSYVGLAQRLGPGTIAGAWLSSMQGPLDATDWPDRIKAANNGPDISFLADGSIIPREDAT